MVAEHKKNHPDLYEIKIRGLLDTSWAEWFYDMVITCDRDGITTLRGLLPDQTVLHSVLDRIRDMNLELISVNQIKSNGQTVNYEVEGMSHEE